MSHDAPAKAPMSARMARSSAIMAVGTVLSRMSGFVRAALIAAVLGTGAVADVFTVPNTIPNAIYILVAGGVLNSVLVPQLVRAMKEDADGGEAYAQRLMTAACGVLLVATIAATAAAPWLMRLYVDSSLLEPELRPVYDSMVLLAYFTLPQIFFYGFYVLLGQVLNARGRFGPMMFAPILNNLVAIAVFAAYLVVLGTKEDPVFTVREAFWLGFGSTLGIILQALILIPFVWKSGLRLKIRTDLRGVGLGKAGRLGVWTIAFVILNQIALLVVVRLSTSGTAASVGSSDAAGLAAYQNAFLLIMVPHSILTVSVATALLPTMSARAAGGDRRGMGAELSGAMRTCLSLVVPIAMVFVVLSGLLAAVLFGYGAAAGQTSDIGRVLLFMAPGLVGFTLHYLTLRGFYALEDTKTPFLVQFAVAGTNIVAALGLTAWARSIGRDDLIAVALAASWSLSYLVGSTVSLAVLRRRVPSVESRTVYALALRAAIAAVPGTVVAGALVVWVPGTQTVLGRFVVLALAGIAAAFTYLLFARLLKLEEPAALVRLMTRRGRSGGASPGPTSGPNNDGPAGPPNTSGGAPGSLGPPSAQPDGLGEDVPTGPHQAFSDDPTGPHATGQSDTDLPSQEPLPHRLDSTWGGATVATTTTTPTVGGVRGRSGHRVVGRYELDDLVESSTDGMSSWRARDTVLGRPVMVQTLPVTHPRAEAFVAAAHRAAQASDPRLLRVLDAETDAGTDDDEGDVYVVREWVDGLSLADIVRQGPLSAEDAATLSREVASALAAAHRDGLCHGRLTPGQVIVAHDGSVKVTGIESQRAVRGPRPHGDAEAWWTAGVRADVQGAARVLYAGLTGKWPLDPDDPQAGADALPAAPMRDARVAHPSQVKAGVSRELGSIAMRALDTGSPSRPDALLSADALASALASVTPPPGAGPALAGSRVQAAVLPAVSQQRAASTGMRQEPAEKVSSVDLPPADPADRRPSWWAVASAGVAGSLLLGGLALLAAQLILPDPQAGSNNPAPTSAVLPTVRPILAADDFDPLGDKRENPDSASSAIDGDRRSAWKTSTYYSELDRQKAGVGLVLDLGTQDPVRVINLELLGSGTDVEVRVAPGADSPPSQPDDWDVAAESPAAPATLSLAVSDPVTSRFVLIWFTALPQVDGGWRGGIREVEVRG